MQSSKGYMGLRSRSVIYTRAFAILQSCPNVRVSLQHEVLRKKIYKVHTRYLAIDIHADLLA